MNGLQRLMLVEVKVKRAKQYLVELERLLEPFRTLQGAVLRSKKNPKTGKWEKEIPEVEVPILDLDSLAVAGDVIHNLRSSLDHLAYHLVAAGTGGKFPKYTGFPIADSAEGYKAEKKRRKVKRMRSGAVKAIDSLQPYKNGKGDALWRIHKLDRADKHRLLVTVAELAMCAHDVGGEVFVLEAETPDFIGIFQREVNKNPNFPVAKSLRQTKVPHGDPLLPTLHQFVQLVENLVPTFLPYLD